MVDCFGFNEMFLDEGVIGNIGNNRNNSNNSNNRCHGSNCRYVKNMRW